MATAIEESGDFERFEIAQFCKENKIKKNKLAAMMGVDKQRIYNIETSPNKHVIDFNEESGEVRIVRKEAVINKCFIGRG